MGKPSVAQATHVVRSHSRQPLGPFFVGRSAQNLLQQEWKAFGCWANFACPVSRKSLAATPPQSRRRSAGGREAIPLAYLLLDAAVHSGPLTGGASRDGVCGNSAGSGAGPNIGRGVLRQQGPPLATAWRHQQRQRRRRRQDAGAGRFCDVSAPWTTHGFAEEYALAVAEKKWAAKLTVPGYVVDSDDTAIKTVALKSSPEAIGVAPNMSLRSCPKFVTSMSIIRKGISAWVQFRMHSERRMKDKTP